MHRLYLGDVSVSLRLCGRGIARRRRRRVTVEVRMRTTLRADDSQNDQRRDPPCPTPRAEDDRCATPSFEAHPHPWLNDVMSIAEAEPSVESVDQDRGFVVAGGPGTARPCPVIAGASSA